MLPFFQPIFLWWFQTPSKCVQRSPQLSGSSGHLFRSSSLAVCFNDKNNQKLHGVRSRLHGGCFITSMLQRSSHSCTRTAMCRWTLSWWRIHHRRSHIISTCSLVVHFFLSQTKQTPFLLHFPCFQPANTPPIFCQLLLAPLVLQRGTCNCFHKISNNLRSISHIDVHRCFLERRTKEYMPFVGIQIPSEEGEHQFWDNRCKLCTANLMLEKILQMKELFRRGRTLGSLKMPAQTAKNFLRKSLTKNVKNYLLEYWIFWKFPFHATENFENE